MNLAFLILGTVAFTAIAAVLLTLQNRLHAHWRLRAAEATFLTGISHSLRTPISGIRAAAQALASADLDEAQRARLIDAIVRETRRLGLRVDNRARDRAPRGRGFILLEGVGLPAVLVVNALVHA